MITESANFGTWWPRKRRMAIATLMGLALICQPVFLLVAGAQVRKQRGAAAPQEMSDAQRVTHVLSRLTFGARPGDVARVEAMGVAAFIAQQLDPDSVDDSAVEVRLAKLPTLGMATPVIISQYTPPKPATSPSPSPAKPAEKTDAVKVPVLPTPAPQGEVKMEAKKDATPAESQKPATESMKTADGLPKASDPAQNKPPAPKPTPPPKNPQMVVTD